MADTVTIKKTTLFWICVTFMSCSYFYYVYVYPSPNLNRFILKSTYKATSNTTELHVPAKVLMTDPFLIFFGYPVSHFFLDDVGLKKYPDQISPNLITLIHLVVSFIAVYLLASSSMPQYSKAHSPCKGEENNSSPVLRIPIPTPFAGDTVIAVSSSERDHVLDYPVTFYTDNDVSLPRLRLAAAVIIIRCVLDSMDGALSRAHRQMGVTSSGTFLHMSGALIDIVSDTVGVLSMGGGLIYHFYTRKVVIHRATGHGNGNPSSCLAPYHRMRTYFHSKVNPVLLVRIIPVLACVMMASRGLFWEHYILEFSNIFEQNQTPFAKSIEDSLAVKLVYLCGQFLVLML
eukprot:NODE_2176_length_1662_cov_79.244314_g1862_i0.p1 GENE.NODE_2176_length_1662_cov_79.244314_g1862_i0~~NODE_2176_length_1662_cov_79.244314_g1862_i0.p1  ORF type:complete len:345 (-),score=40.65 NODE_2176_length_1662_cov_79.244314_g1862_i0:526-1560(-)